VAKYKCRGTAVTVRIPTERLFVSSNETVAFFDVKTDQNNVRRYAYNDISGRTRRNGERGPLETTANNSDVPDSFEKTLVKTRKCFIREFVGRRLRAIPISRGRKFYATFARSFNFVTDISRDRRTSRAKTFAGQPKPRAWSGRAAAVRAICSSWIASGLMFMVQVALIKRRT